MPGVSTRMTWLLPISAMPRTGPRVVCALWVTMETLAPTSALVRVDLPLFGAPISATKPQRVGCSADISAISGRLPNPLAHEHGERCRLLGGAFVGSLPALGRNAVDLHLGGEFRRVVRPFAGDLEITRQRQTPPLRPFLQHGFGVGRGLVQIAKIRSPETMHHVARGLVAAIGEDGAQHGLAGIGE